MLPRALTACLAGLLAWAGVARAEPGANAPIRVGEYGSLTGAEATFGQSTHNGITLAVDEINAAGGVGGRPLEVVVYDDQGKSQEAGSAVTRLVTEDRVVAVLGEVASSLSIAGGRVAQQYQVPMISPSSTNVAVTQIGDMVSRVCFIDAFQGEAAAGFLRDHLGARRAAILYDQGSAYSKGLKDDFARALVARGGEVVSEQAYAAGDTDFSAQLTTIRGASPEVIFLPGYYTDVGNVAIQARKLGIDAALLGGDGWDSAKLAEIGGAAIEGAYYVNHYAPQEPRPEVEAFVAAYRARFGETPDGLAALGYDAARVLAAAMVRAPSLEGPELAAAIAATADFPGVTGRITMDAARNAQKPAVVVQLQQGKPVWVASVAPTQATPAPAPAPPRAAAAPPAPPVPPSISNPLLTKLLQTAMDGVAVGSLYALIALGYTMVYGILRFINFAHSDVFMLGAWGSWAVAAGFGWTAPDAVVPVWAAPVVIAIVMVGCGLLGFTIERVAYKPLRAAPRINVLIAAIGVSLLLENLGQLPLFFGTQPQRMPSLVPDLELASFAGVSLRLVDVLVIGVAVLLMLALEYVVYGTKLGLAMRAVSYDTRVAALMGIPVDRVISLTFVIGSALAAAAGFLAAMKYPGLNQPAHATWVLLGLKAFVAAVIGGIGNLRGAMMGGLLIGMVELFGAAYLSPHLRDVYVFTLLILVLLFKPSGLLGKAVVEKV